MNQAARVTGVRHPTSPEAPATIDEEPSAGRPRSFGQGADVTAALLLMPRSHSAVRRMSARARHDDVAQCVVSNRRALPARARDACPPAQSRWMSAMQLSRRSIRSSRPIRATGGKAHADLGRGEAVLRDRGCSTSRAIAVAPNAGRRVSCVALSVASNCLRQGDFYRIDKTVQ
jgi:hypothetical protein